MNNEAGLAKEKVCGFCSGRGIGADYVGLEMRCVETECPYCNGSGIDAASRLPARVDSTTHEFKGDVGYGVCGECGRERNDYEYHHKPARVETVKPVYGNSECALCNAKLYGKKAFAVPIPGLTYAQQIVCESCAPSPIPSATDYCPKCGHNLDRHVGDRGVCKYSGDCSGEECGCEYKVSIPTASEDVDTEIGHTTLELGKIGRILFREAEPESASEDVGLPGFRHIMDEQGAYLVEEADPIRVQWFRKADVERRLLEARKEIANLRRSNADWIRLADFNSAQFKRAEKAEAALAQRDEEIARLKVWKEQGERLAHLDPCEYDHHGLCQAHGLHERPCPHEILQAEILPSLKGESNG